MIAADTSSHQLLSAAFPQPRRPRTVRMSDTKWASPPPEVSGRTIVIMMALGDLGMVLLLSSMLA